MMKKMRIQSDIVFTLLVFLLFVCGSVLGAEDATGEECKDDFQKVMACLDYANGKASTPSTECCSSVKGIKESKPKCLCSIIQHSGSEALKNLGVQEAKLLQLPSACKLQNASISECPKLLGLSPSSPDAAIFANSSSTATPTKTESGTSAPEKADGTSSGAKHGAYLVGPMIAIAIFFYAIPTGSASMLHSIWG